MFYGFNTFGTRSQTVPVRRLKVPRMNLHENLVRVLLVVVVVVLVVVVPARKSLTLGILVVVDPVAPRALL